MMNRRD